VCEPITGENLGRGLVLPVAYRKREVIVLRSKRNVRLISPSVRDGGLWGEEEEGGVVRRKEYS